MDRQTDRHRSIDRQMARLKWGREERQIETCTKRSEESRLGEKERSPGKEEREETVVTRRN